MPPVAVLSTGTASPISCHHNLQAERNDVRLRPTNWEGALDRLKLTGAYAQYKLRVGGACGP